MLLGFMISIPPGFLFGIMLCAVFYHLFSNKGAERAIVAVLGALPVSMAIWLYYTIATKGLDEIDPFFGGVGLWSIFSIIVVIVRAFIKDKN